MKTKSRPCKKRHDIDLLSETSLPNQLRPHLGESSIAGERELEVRNPCMQAGEINETVVVEGGLKRKHSVGTNLASKKIRFDGQSSRDGCVSRSVPSQDAHLLQPQLKRKSVGSQSHTIDTLAKRLKLDHLSLASMCASDATPADHIVGGLCSDYGDALPNTNNDVCDESSETVEPQNVDSCPSQQRFAGIMSSPVILDFETGNIHHVPYSQRLQGDSCDTDTPGPSEHGHTLSPNVYAPGPGQRVRAPFRTGPPVEYQRFGPCNRVCRHCRALFWDEEKLSCSTATRGPLYHRCCLEGRALITVLDSNNALVQLFRSARDKLQQHDIPEFKVRLFSIGKASQYEFPTADHIGAIVFDDSAETEADFDVSDASAKATKENCFRQISKQQKTCRRRLSENNYSKVQHRKKKRHILRNPKQMLNMLTISNRRWFTSFCITTM
ncbi:hypothetical protein CTI12_AA308180 [Artemisia annua]|uniref:Uncharacterized protein n=1 Tax=Artemisia annua TaxID=35608 RepID=A0A2U1N4N7_ARTAN|nr:hypothetical protein CTI12_AA308180 [Artemisia annua]